MKKILFTLMVVALLACPAFGVARYRQHQVVIVDEFGDAVTNIDQIEIQDAGTSTTSTIFNDRAGDNSMTNPITTGSANSTFVQSLGLVTWFQAAPDYKIIVTESGASQSLTIDNQSEGDTRFPFYANYIGVASSLQVLDASLLRIGTGSDFLHDWDNANSRYVIYPAGDGGRMDFGNATVHTDVYFHAGDITTDLMLFDEGALQLTMIDIDLQMDDEAKLFFGDSSDVTIEYDESNNDLDILSTTTLDLISFGATGDGYDLEWFSTTAGDYALFDYSADALLLEDLTLALGDGELLLFGDTIGTGTMSLSVSTAKLSLLQVVADTGTFDIGAAGTDVPTIWHGETSGAEVTFTGDTVIVDGIDMTFNDDDILNFGDSAEITMQYDEDGDNDLQITGDVTIEGTTPLLTIGDAGAEDTILVYDGTAQDYHIGLDDTGGLGEDILTIGLGSTLGTTPILSFNATQQMILEEGELFYNTTDDTIAFASNDTDLILSLKGVTDKDVTLVLDGTAQDFYFGLDDTDDDLNIGIGTAPGTTAAIEITEDARVTITTAINVPYEVLTGADTVTVDQGGSIFALNAAGGFTCVLPTVANSAGMKLRYVVQTAPTTAYIITSGNSLENVIYGLTLEAENDTTEDGPVAQAEDTITLVANIAVIGDWIELVSDGVYWYVSGATAADGGITLTQAD